MSGRRKQFVSGNKNVGPSSRVEPGQGNALGNGHFWKDTQQSPQSIGVLNEVLISYGPLFISLCSLMSVNCYPET